MPRRSTASGGPGTPAPFQANQRWVVGAAAEGTQAVYSLALRNGRQMPRPARASDCISQGSRALLSGREGERASRNGPKPRGEAGKSSMARCLLSLRRMQPSLPAEPASSTPRDLTDRALALLAPHDTPVLFQGEGGAGRSFLARCLHALSPRANAPFVKIDCRGLSNLSGSVRELDAKIATAGRGSVLFEDVDLLSLPLQATLMAWLESRLGRVDAPRVLSSSGADLDFQVQSGRFREDLRARIDVFEVPVPPLRERTAEIPSLARLLVQKAARRLGIPPLPLTAEVEALLVGHSWPGNLRELANVMERALALSSGPTLDPATLQLRAPGRG